MFANATSLVRNHDAPEWIAVAICIASGVRRLCVARNSGRESALTIPRRAFPAQVRIYVNACPDTLSQTLEFQQAATAWLPFKGADEGTREFRDQAQLKRSVEVLHGLLYFVISCVRHFAHSP
jgi:hypothetical protein